MNFFPPTNSLSLSVRERHLLIFYEACYRSTVRIVSRLMSFVDVAIAIVSATSFDYNDDEHFQSLLGTHLLLAKNLGVQNFVFLVDHVPNYLSLPYGTDGKNCLRRINIQYNRGKDETVRNDLRNPIIFVCSDFFSILRKY